MWELYTIESEKVNCVEAHCPNCNEVLYIPTVNYLYKYCPYCGHENGNDVDVVAENMPNKYKVHSWNDIF